MIPLALATLAAYRVSRMIIAEYGPFHMFERLREWAQRYERLNEGLSCPLCLSFWLSLVFGAMAVMWWDILIIKIILSWLGIAGANVIIYRIVE